MPVFDLMPAANASNRELEASIRRFLHVAVMIGSIAVVRTASVEFHPKVLPGSAASQPIIEYSRWRRHSLYAEYIPSMLHLVVEPQTGRYLLQGKLHSNLHDTTPWRVLAVKNSLRRWRSSDLTENNTRGYQDGNLCTGFNCTPHSASN